jgi:hypothetical protein
MVHRLIFQEAGRLKWERAMANYIRQYILEICDEVDLFGVDTSAGLSYIV